jgi:broad specificity phosphatase PhoE
VPRFSAEAVGPGLRIPGLYEQLLERERDKHDGPSTVDPRWARQRPGEEAPAVYRRPDRLLRALEAGETVLVQRSSARLAYRYLSRERRDPFPWHRSVRTVQVTPEDVVTPSAREIPWYGCAADEFFGY